MTIEQADHDNALVITQVDAGDVITLVVSGDIDLATAPRLGVELDRLFERPDRGPVQVDLTAVTFLGSPGITVLIDADWQAEQLGVTCTLVLLATGTVRRTLQSAGVADHFTVLLR